MVWFMTVPSINSLLIVMFGNNVHVLGSSEGCNHKQLPKGDTGCSGIQHSNPSNADAFTRCLFRGRSLEELDAGLQIKNRFSFFLAPRDFYLSGSFIASHATRDVDTTSRALAMF